MKKLMHVFVACACVVAGANGVFAADLASLEVGSFTPFSDGQVTAQAALINESGQKQSLAMTIDAFEVTTSKDLAEATSNFSGQFELAQPLSMPIKSMEVVIDGTIIKEAGASAMIEVKVGGATKSINWNDADALAQQFSHTVTIDLPDGRLPAPFPVEAIARVKKSAAGGAALVSLKAIRVNMTEISTASVD